MLGVVAGITAVAQDNYTELLHDAGWWSVGLWLTAVIGFFGAYAAAKYLGGLWRGAGWLLLIFAAPAGAAVYGAVLLATADPNPGCTYDCIGRIVIVILAAVGVWAWIVGLIAGAVSRRLTERNLRGGEGPETESGVE